MKIARFKSGCKYFSRTGSQAGGATAPRTLAIQVKKPVPVSKMKAAWSPNTAKMRLADALTAATVPSRAVKNPRHSMAAYTVPWMTRPRRSPSLRRDPTSSGSLRDYARRINSASAGCGRTLRERWPPSHTRMPLPPTSKDKNLLFY